MGQDCILLAGFQPAFLRLSSASKSADEIGAHAGVRLLARKD
jgi:hypothetical protein